MPNSRFATRTSKKLVALTGGTGRLGRVLVPMLLKKDLRLRLLVRDAAKAKKIFLKQVGAGEIELIECDLLDSGAKNLLLLARALRGTSAVVHLAALVDIGASSAELYRNNVAATKNLLEASRRACAKKFVYCSSTAVYGTPAQAPADEATPFKPIYAYGSSKMHAEMEVAAAGIPHVILRPSVIYGKNMATQFDSMLTAIERGKARIVGEGNNLLPFVHEEDVARAFALAVINPSALGDFIISDEARLTQKQALEIVARELGVPAPAKHASVAFAKLAALLHSWFSKLRGRKPHFTPELVELTAANRVFSSAKARKLLGWRPEKRVLAELPAMVREWKKSFSKIICE